MTPAALHEQHKARVLDSPRQHHSEATDALVVEALHIAEQMAAAEGCLRAWTPSGDCDCGPCARLAKVRAALKALGK